MKAVLNLVLIAITIHLVIFMFNRDTSIAKLPAQGNLHKVVLAAG